MDSVTHIVLGACIGEAMMGKQVGKKAMLIGAVAQSLPDIDFVASFWMNTVDELVVHRGITHSLLFILFVSPALGWLSRATVPPRQSMARWTTFFAVEMFVHIFLDAFNNYGVGWFEPFNNYRISFNTVYVADPLITIFPLIAFLVLLITRGKTPQRRKWWLGSLIFTSAYLLVCIFNKWQVSQDAKRAFALKSIDVKSYLTTPAPLQSFLWMVAAGDGKGFHVGYRSVFDQSDDIDFRYFPVNEHLLDTLDQHDEVVKLKMFSQGFYTVEQRGDKLLFNDLRFGQIIGWHDPANGFVFHYFLQQPGNNELVVQRGRFAKWDAEVLKSFLLRVIGKHPE